MFAVTANQHRAGESRPARLGRFRTEPFREADQFSGFSAPATVAHNRAGLRGRPPRTRHAGGSLARCRTDRRRRADALLRTSTTTANQVTISSVRVLRTQPDGPALSGRDVVVAVRRGPVALVEDVLDVELRLPVLVEGGVDRAVEADEAGELHAIVGARKRVRKGDDAECARPHRRELVLVPQRELVERHQLHDVAGDDRRRGVAGHPRVGVGIAEHALPIGRDVTFQLGLETADAVASRQDEEAGIGRIGERHVLPVELVDRRAEQELRADVVLDPDLLVLEPLRLEDRGAVGERAELVAGGRQVRDRVDAVDRQRLDRQNVPLADPSNPGFFILSGSNRIRGFETELKGYVTADWQSVLGYAYTDARVTSDTSATIVAGNVVQLVPLHQFSFWNKYQFTPMWAGALGVIYFSDSFASSDDTVKLPGWVRLDGAVYATIDQHWKAQLNVEN
ncbi:MAG: TonB-dependent receptor, partial [Alphaproteobacteria bacterium]|nr:TonB-dependent receptor [Alphaproteobacteria bacterium]